jgi:regulator of protease activity HflC (stomatin/prohibitin superfamily)
MDSSTQYLIGIVVIVILAIIYIISGSNIVSEWNRRPVLRFGKYVRTLEPGYSFVEPFTHRVLDEVSINDTVAELEMDAGTSLQTHDNIPVAFTTVMTTKIDPNNVKLFTTIVQDGEDAVESRTLTAVGEVVSATALNDILHHREAVCIKIVSLLQSRVSAWGVRVIAVELRNIQITDPSIQEAIALAARARKEADAELVRAEAQIQIAKELTLAAQQLDAGGWRLKDAEVLLELTRSAENNTIIIPSQMLTGLFGSALPIARALGNKA